MEGVEDNLKILPLTHEEIGQFLKEEDSILEVNYNDSKIQGQFFLNYIANLKLNVDLFFNSEEIDLELLRLYTSNKYELNIPSLNMCLVQIILDIKGIGFDLCFNRIIEKKQSWDFYDTNKEMLDELIRFLDSLLYSIPFVNHGYKETIGKSLIDNGQMELIDDDTLDLGLNTVKILEMKDFVPLYFSGTIKTKPAYYKAQMEGNFYNGNSLFNYLIKTDNPIMVLCTGIMEGWISSDEFLKATGVKNVSPS